ncbi:MAG: S1C family serine protease [Desulfatibacillaceae bacterium]
MDPDSSEKRDSDHPGPYGLPLALAVLLVLCAHTAWALTPSETIVIEAYKKAAPSVAHVRSVTVRFDFFHRAIPLEGTGSGVVMDRKGRILTNAHVIRAGEGITVTLHDQSEWPAEVVETRPEQDLAVIRIDAPAQRLVPIPTGTSSDLATGRIVLAIGNPFGLDSTLTTGVVSSLGRSLAGAGGIRLDNLIQTDAAINPGNSGGPLLSTKGELLGINTAIISPTGGSAGVGFAIPVSTVKREFGWLFKGSRPFFNKEFVYIIIVLLVVAWALRRQARARRTG